MASLRWRRNALGAVVDLPIGWRTRVLAQAPHLRRFPELGTPATGPHAGRRRLIVGPYSLVYEYDAEAGIVTIVAVARGGPLFR